MHCHLKIVCEVYTVRVRTQILGLVMVQNRLIDSYTITGIGL